MFIKKIIVLLLVLPLVAFAAKPVTTSELEISELSIPEQINFFATQYGVESSLVEKMVQCESEYDITAKGDGGRAYGLMQYHKESFKRHAKLFGEDLDYYSSHDQLKLGIWAISEGHGREWTSYRAIKNGGTYSFYSKLLKKHYTVKC